MGVGKTTTGRALSAATTLPLVDMDDILTARFGPISRQFERDGERAFRARERALLEELCDGHARVLSTGGGVWVSELHRRWLREHYFTVVLTVPFEQLQQRALAAGRPLWDDQVHARYLEREAAYRDADLVLAADRPTEELVEEILRCWSA